MNRLLRHTLIPAHWYGCGSHLLLRDSPTSYRRSTAALNYRVLQQTSAVNYLVEPLDVSSDKRRRGQEIVHVSRLKKYYDPLVCASP